MTHDKPSTFKSTIVDNLLKDAQLCTIILMNDYQKISCRCNTNYNKTWYNTKWLLGWSVVKKMPLVYNGPPERRADPKLHGTYWTAGIRCPITGSESPHVTGSPPIAKHFVV